MTPEQWKRIEAIFHRAVALEGAERARLLDEACGGDEALRRRLELMAEHDRQPTNYLDVPVNRERALDAAPPATDPLLGGTIGPYRILERIAAGGMGVVYRARREGGAASQLVAIKVVRWDLDGARILRRFEVEREVLASLDHPNIARLLDGGATADGLPYIVMEHIDGQPIDRHCDERRLTIRSRLALFAVVCRAVHAAHQKLVVHRDLKPSNILVTPDGEPKILDFGIARILDPGDPGQAEPTATAARALTPAFASPEQLRGEPVTTATDVYSLGVLLHRLLTGRAPRGVIEQGAGGDGDGQAAAADIAARRRTSPEALRRELRGDIERVVMMALREEASRRYGSAGAFAEDVDRCLGGFPVAARPDTLGYRAAKFVRRNPLAAAAAAAAVLALFGGAFVAGIAARAALRQRDQADAARQRALREAEYARVEAHSATELSRLVIDAFLLGEAAGDGAGAGPGAEVGDGAEATARHLNREVGRVRRQYHDQPQLQANLLDALGRVYLGVHRYDEAREAIDEAARLRAATFGPQSPEAALSLNSQGELLHATGDYQGAAARFSEAVAIGRSLPEAAHHDFAVAANNLGTALRALRRLEEAEALHREALAMRRAHLGEDDPHVAESLNNLAAVLLDRGDQAGAEEALHKSAEIRRRILGEDHPLSVQSLNNLAVTLHRGGKLDEAEPLYRDSIALYHVIPDADPAALGRTLSNYARVLISRGRLEQAAAALDEALEIQRRTLGGEHTSVANVLTGLAQVRTLQGNPGAARPLLADGLRIRRAALPPDHPIIAETLGNYGALLLELGDLPAAEPVLREAVGLLDQGRATWRLGAAASDLGACLLGQGRREEAEPYLRRGAEVLKATVGEEDERTHRARQRLDGVEDRPPA